MKIFQSRKHWRAASFVAALLAQFVVVSAVSAAKIGGMAPNFTLKSATGKNLRLSEYRGQVVMLNFWSARCRRCRQQMPVLDQLYRRYRSVGFELLGVNIDAKIAKAKDTARKLKVVYPILFDSEKTVSHLYDVNAIPTTVMIDRDGRLRYVYRGHVSRLEKKYQKQIRGLLKEYVGDRRVLNEDFY